MSDRATPPTARLYRDDSHLLAFEAKVIATRIDGDRAAVELDRTAFYPTGGGQPHDLGTLGAWKVEEVATTDDDRVVHFLARRDDGPRLPEVGATLAGAIDAARRRDHLQQHTGQHLLSQALVRVGAIDTSSFHLGPTSATIDVDAKLTEETLERAVALTNEVIYDDRPLRIHEVGVDELARFAIRRQTFHGARIRLIEVEDFDVSTCGGTHAKRTGEVGIVAALGIEKTKGIKRVEFVCGGRAQRAFAATRATLLDAARALSTAPDQLADAVRRLAAAEASARKRARLLFEAALPAAAEALRALATAAGPWRFAAARRDDLSIDEAQTLVRAAIEANGYVIALTVGEGSGAKLLLARSRDVECSMGEIVKSLASRFALRGGGSPQQAQAALPAATDIDPVFAALRELLGTR